METFVTHCASPIGILRISGTVDGITGVTFLEGWEEHRACLQERSVLPSVLTECCLQLQEYFEGKRKDLRTVRVVPVGTDFQQSVWETLLRIPWGECMTYQELGRQVGYPLAAQAIGGAVSHNPLTIIIPCHRVLPNGEGEVGGYAWGAWRKRWLLRHEGNIVPPHSLLGSVRKSPLQAGGG